MSGVFRESVWPWSKCQLQSTAQATSAQFTPTAYLATTKQLADMDVMNTADANPQNVQDLTVFVQGVMQSMQDKFKTMSDQIVTRLDDMGNRIDDLERNIADLMTQAGVEEK